MEDFEEKIMAGVPSPDSDRLFEIELAKAGSGIAERRTAKKEIASEELGEGVLTLDVYRTPTVVPGIDHIVAVGCADLAAYALRDDGVLFAWGLNGNGELGDGTTVDRLDPRPCLLPSVVRFYVGDADVQAFTASGERFGWGDAVVGDGSFKTRLAPVPVFSQ